jgi:hypothetical protein
MNHGLLIRICALAMLLSLHAHGADRPLQLQDRKVRVVCRRTQTYFDVSVSLKPFADDISPRTFLEIIADQNASRVGLEFIGWCNILRWDADSKKYVRVERFPLRNGKAFLDRVQNGDLLLFNSPVCTF